MFGKSETKNESPIREGFEMEEGLLVLFGMSLAALMTVSYRHQDLAPVVLASVLKLGVLIGLAIPAYLLLSSPDGAEQSAPSAAALSGVSSTLSLREALSMISCMILGPLVMSAFLARVRNATTYRVPSSSVDTS